MSRVRGLLTQSGEWQCDCTPRLPAIYLQVKKENHNKGRHFYTCQKPEDERCGFFLWDTDAEKRERAQFGETLTVKKGGAQGTTISLPVIPAKETEIPVPDIPAAVMPSTTTAGGIPPSKQPQPQRPQTPVTSVPAGRIYPTLPTTDEEDEFNYFETPSKPPVQPVITTKSTKRAEETYEWEESDEEVTGYRRPYGGKKPRFELPRADPSMMEEIELSPPQSPPPVAPLHRKPASTTLADPFTTPPKQIHSTPHTPPDTRALKSPTTTLQPLSLSLLYQLDPYKESLGRHLYDRLSDHLMRCGRVADGAVKGRDAARAVNRKKDIRIEELERRVRILESEREVDRAVIGALKRNVDVLTGKVNRRDD